VDNNVGRSSYADLVGDLHCRSICYALGQTYTDEVGASRSDIARLAISALVLIEVTFKGA
jgi:predicted deacylase